MLPYNTSHSVLTDSLLILSLLFSPTLLATNYNLRSTIGAITQVPVPMGWQFQYQQAVDACVISDMVSHQIIVTFAPKMDPKHYLQILLTELGATQYLPKIKVINIANKRVGSVQDQEQTKEWILARIFHKLTGALACLLILPENYLQSAVITDTPLPQKFPCKTNILRDHHTNL